MSDNARHTEPATSRPMRPRQQVLQACRTDDVALIAQAFEAASQADSHTSLDEIQSQTVQQATKRGSNSVLSYALEHGAKVPTTSDISMNEEPPPHETFEILQQHGWNINARRKDEKPFLWNIVHLPELVDWALQHGASVVAAPPMDSDQDTNRLDLCPTLLEVAARRIVGIQTFEKLRTKGAELGKRTLHFAAGSAATGKEDALALVHHLVDTLGCDVNALDQPEGWQLGNHWGTPLCYVAESGNPKCEEVARYLLRQGARPVLEIGGHTYNSLGMAEVRRNEVFTKTVEKWQSDQQSN